VNESDEHLFLLFLFVFFAGEKFPCTDVQIFNSCCVIKRNRETIPWNKSLFHPPKQQQQQQQQQRQQQHQQQHQQNTQDFPSGSC